MMIDSLFFKELPLKMGAHICGIDRFHIHFIGAKIDTFLRISKDSLRQRCDEMGQKWAPRYLRATFVRRGRDLAERFGLYQIVLDRVDL